MGTTRGKRPDESQILRWLAVLDKNNMNQLKTARECGISRSSIIKYKEKYWDLYLKEKATVKNDTRKIAATKAIVEHKLDEVRDIILEKAFTPIINEINIRFTDPDQLKKIPTRILIEGFREIAPFVAEKQGVIGTNPINDNDPVTRHTTIVQNIISNLKISQ
ncbi:MAG: hypothetical protein JXP36_06570 [Bacteroidales bacterium]|nr:hypothetical protein [Bacteroidales bacterium]